MRFFLPAFLSLTVLASFVSAQDSESATVPREKHNYQSDVARLRKIVINSLYSHKEIFLRELISNANDALEKLRLTSLTDKAVWNGVDPLNITIKAEKNADGKGGKIIISDTGIGMTPEELATNLGTLAKSGTSDFLAKAENSQDGNLIGAFGLGFYSSFLVADQVYVSSVAAKSVKNPNPTQYVFSSSADDSSFEIFPDPRGNTLGRGTEINLILKGDSLEYLDTQVLSRLVNKHSTFSTSFPVYLWTERTEELPVEEEYTDTPADESVKNPSEEVADDDEAIVEDEKNAEVPSPSKTKTVLVEEWSQLNTQPPLWTRDPKNISKEEYSLFYQTTFKDFSNPLAWHHFSADSGSGVSFRAILYIPSRLEDTFWQQALTSTTTDIRLMVKRVFITSNLGEDAVPKWASWIKAVIDADDLPLNVSRETLQSTRFLKQIKQILLKHLIQLFTRIATEEPEKYKELQKVYGPVLKLGAVEDTKNRDKLTALTRFTTNQRNNTSFDQYLENKKQGQKQIFYLAEAGKSTADLAKSVFVEKLHARGYEVLLLNEPLDEILVQNLRTWKKIPFQDVAKAGLKFGDEESEAEEKETQAALTTKFRPLLDWLKKEAQDVVRDVVVSNRLVTSPCAIVADVHGYTANVERMMSASHSQSKSPMYDFAKKQKLLEINPRSPLIEGLLRRIEQLPSEEEERDLEAEDELREVSSILIDGALVRSGFDVPDSNSFFARMDRVLRRSLGVSETAPTDMSVKPAPPVDPELHEDMTQEPFSTDGFPDMRFPDQPPDYLKDKLAIEVDEVDTDGNVVEHDEL